MLIKLDYLIKKYNLKIRGIVHVGAHFGQEYDIYVDNGINNIVFIEPCKKAFEVLKRDFQYKPTVHLFNYACGKEAGTALMHVETANTGMSNSLLKPKDHLKHYPTITFDGTELVDVIPLDSLQFDRQQHNLLMMDVQGFEGSVLKGATETLKSIDYVYTEVNNQELYESATQVEEIDELLSEFERVEIKWTDAGWGDCLLIRKSLII